MDLLPKSSEEFAKEEYWNEFFKKRKDVPFEWYGEYLELAELLHKYITVKDKLLVVGCGNSQIGPELFHLGIKNQINIDISPVVINQMSKRHPDVEFKIGDVTHLEYDDSSFSTVLDKGTFDALCPATTNSNTVDEPLNASSTGSVMLQEISRIISSRGRFICVSLLQPHVASRLLSHFHSLGWMVRVHRCIDAEKRTEERNSENTYVFPVFMTIFTKMSLPVGFNPILEASNFANNKFTRYKTLEELLEHIKEQQNFAVVRRGLKNLRAFGDKELSMKLASSSTGEDRYCLFIVDVATFLKNPVQKRFGIFIVPQGRESEWLFGCTEGRKQLAHQVGFSRLVIVHLIRGQHYTSLEEVQKEINDPLASLAPAAVAEKKIKAPVMTAGNDVGSRSIVLEGHSEFSGDFVVEDVTCEGKLLRRLIFLNSPNVIQSEVELKYATKRQKSYKIPITNTLSCQHHSIMLIGFGMLKHFFNFSEDNPSINGLIIGLGGGLLASFLINFMSMLKLTAVEIDPDIVKVANDLFGLPKNDDRLQVVVDDGLKFIQSTEKKYNIILVDVDNKSQKEGLSCPPPEFLEDSELEKMKSVMDPEKSILILNLVCRNEELRLNYLRKIDRHFQFICYYDVPEEVNRLVFCFSDGIELSSIKTNLPAIVHKSIKFILHKTENSSASQESSNRKVGKGKGTSEGAAKSLCSFDGALDDIDSISESFKILTKQNN